MKAFFLLVVLSSALLLMPQITNATSSTTLTVKYTDGSEETYNVSNDDGNDDWWVKDSRIPESACAGSECWNGINGASKLELCEVIKEVHWVLNNNRLVISDVNCDDDHESTTTTIPETTTTYQTTTSTDDSTTTTSTNVTTTTVVETTTTIPETTTTGIVTTTSGVTTTDVTTTTIPPTTSSVPDLPDTGYKAWNILILAGLAVVTGCVIMYLRRR